MPLGLDADARATNVIALLQRGLPGREDRPRGLRPRIAAAPVRDHGADGLARPRARPAHDAPVGVPRRGPLHLRVDNGSASAHEGGAEDPDVRFELPLRRLGRHLRGAARRPSGRWPPAGCARGERADASADGAPVRLSRAFRRSMDTARARSNRGGAGSEREWSVRRWVGGTLVRRVGPLVLIVPAVTAGIWPAVRNAGGLPWR